MEFNLSVGMSMEEEYVVTEADTAVHFGSGTVTVLATPKNDCMDGKVFH